MILHPVTPDKYKKLSGIYRIRNTQNGEYYIGSATRFEYRWNIHRHKLKEKKHDSIILQNSWNKRSEDVFRFEILMLCDKEDLVMYEQKYLDYFLPKYNVSPTATSSLGIKRSEETKRRISVAKKGVPHKNKRAKITFSEERRKGCARPGERHGSAKLKDKDVYDILSSSLSNKDLAKKYSVTASSIYCIRQGKTWKHLRRYTLETRDE